MIINKDCRRAIGGAEIGASDGGEEVTLGSEENVILSACTTNLLT
jgi:hypothetical protein